MKKLSKRLAAQMAAACLLLLPHTAGAQVPEPVTDKSRHPTAYVTIHGQAGGDISHEDLVNSGGLVVINPAGSPPGEDSTLTIATYKMSLFIKGQNPVLDKLGIGNRLTDEMKAMIKAAPKGSKVFFEYRRLQLSETVSEYKSHLPPLAFTLTDDAMK